MIVRSLLFSIGLVLGVFAGQGASTPAPLAASDVGPRLIAEAHYAIHETLGKDSILAPLSPRRLSVNSLRIVLDSQVSNTAFALADVTLVGESETWTPEEFETLNNHWAHNDDSISVTGDGIVTIKLRVQVHSLSDTFLLVRVLSKDPRNFTTYSPYGKYVLLEHSP